MIVAGTNTARGYDDLDHRFDSWSAPAIASLDEGWVGELPAMPILTGGTIDLGVIMPLSSRRTAHCKLPGAGEIEGCSRPRCTQRPRVDRALLYLGPRDSLTQVFMPRDERDGTLYGKDIGRRLAIEGFPASFISQMELRNSEAPQFPRPQPGGNGLQALPPPPENMGAALPPRPPSQ